MLRTQLLVWLLVPLSVLFAADAFISYWMALSFSQRAYDRGLVEIARELSLHLEVRAGSLKLDLPEPARRVLFDDPVDRLYYGITVDGKLIDGVTLPAIPALLEEHALYDGHVNGAPVRIVALGVPADAASGRPAAVIRVAETEVKRRELAREILISVIVPQILLILIAAAIVWAGVVRGLAPLKRLQQVVASRSHRERGPVATMDIPGEVRPLIHALNGLLERLDTVLTLQSRFVADAAHQLKTPVAGLQAQVELALREEEPERMRASVAKLCGGLERLSRLVSQLLSLARNEPDAVASVTFERLELNAVAFEAASAWVPEALKKRIDLGFERSERSVNVQGDPVRLRELFDNLLDNAVRYTQEGGRVTVRVKAAPVPSVAVSDDGPAIPEVERQRVFGRFHRLLGASSDGSGLGLAIAQEIARMHGASIALAPDVDGVGNTFTVCFPLARAV
jgi:two-component system sensor histidine kinase TctE